MSVHRACWRRWHTQAWEGTIHPETLTHSDLKQQLQTVLSLGKYRDVAGEGRTFKHLGESLKVCLAAGRKWF